MRRPIAILAAAATFVLVILLAAGIWFLFQPDARIAPFKTAPRVSSVAPDAPQPVDFSTRCCGRSERGL
jgi:hypothetical protein